ncbi:uroporphyrinogen-III synthase [Parvularcula maris]|uniref:Uroporphyrinogen-III synthase n=1 Tax=Parvularcula maris TaxID=2965077 RepID=A0A9X2L853_9PROT|nr:uroporphyrinogen-III synthase [Parvularcula maris]
MSTQVLPCPVTRIVLLPAKLPIENFDTVLLTSPRAVPAAVAAGLPVLAVGEKTAKAAAAAGLTIIAAGAGRVTQDLPSLLPRTASVLHLAGEDIAVDPAPFFAARGHAYRRETVYRAEPLPSLPQDAEECLRRPGELAAIFLSARNAALFAGLARPLLEGEELRLTAFCMSERIAAAAAHTGLFGNVLNADARGPSAFVDFITPRCT